MSDRGTSEHFLLPKDIQARFIEVLTDKVKKLDGDDIMMGQMSADIPIATK